MNNLVRQVGQVEIDWTKFFNYSRLVEEEIEEYSSTEITDRLLLGGIHANPAWDFWFQFLERQWQTHFAKEVVSFANQQTHPQILSLGCGHGGFELSIASQLRSPYGMVAVDLNPHIWDEARRRIEAQKLNIEFRAIDLNFVSIEPNSFDVIFAHASLHHMLNLEHLMTQIYYGLKPQGRFIILDMIGEVQTLFWQENVDFARSLIDNFPASIKSKLSQNPIGVYQPPSLQVGMEGIRQEELELEIDRFFEPIKSFKYNSFMRLIGTNPILGNIFDLESTTDREFLESLCRLDLEQIRNGKLRPTELFAVYQKRSHPPCNSQARVKFLQALIFQQTKESIEDILSPGNDPDIVSMRQEIAQIHAQLAKISQDLAGSKQRFELLDQQNDRLRKYIVWMQGSKFWQLRQLWQLLKSAFGGKNHDLPNPTEPPNNP